MRTALTTTGTIASSWESREPRELAQAAVLAGPDIRDFGWATRKDFTRVKCYTGSICHRDIFATETDTIVVLNRRYEQPAFSSFSMYEDVTYDLTWRHKLTISGGQRRGFACTSATGRPPIDAEDWIYNAKCVGFFYSQQNTSVANWVFLRLGRKHGKQDRGARVYPPYCVVGSQVHLLAD